MSPVHWPDSCHHSDHNIDTAHITAPSVTFPVCSADIADIMSDGDLDLSLSPVKKNVAKQVNLVLKG